MRSLLENQSSGSAAQDAQRCGEEHLGHLLDRVMTIDISGRGAVEVLYGAVRADTGGALSLNAARVLAATLTRGDVAVLATGFPVRPWISPAVGETDGPPGATALARALSMGLGVIPLIVVPLAMSSQVRSSLVAGGVMTLSLEEAHRAVSEPSRPTCAAVVVERAPGRAPADYAESFFAAYNPKLLAAIEHPGANKVGVYNSSLGVDITAGVAPAEALFAFARSRNVTTVSFIDNVNEIGAGSLPEDAMEKLPRSECIAGISPVDHIVVAATANWASYATVAALSVLLEQSELLVSRERDASAIAAVMQAGGVEGVSGSIDPKDGVDAIPTEISGHITDLLAHIARNYLVMRNRGSF